MKFKLGDRVEAKKTHTKVTFGKGRVVSITPRDKYPYEVEFSPVVKGSIKVEIFKAQELTKL